MSTDKKDLVSARPPAPEELTESERVLEKPKELAKSLIPEKAPIAPETIPSAPPSLPALPPQLAILPPAPLFVEIESILADNLQTVYAGLPEEVKLIFKAKGEEVAHTIQVMIENAKVKARRVLKLIVQWLKLIPGMNQFFLEQEATIKTQKLLALATEHKKQV